MSERCAIILLGPPGSGKTTLGRSLSRRAPISVIEVGVLLAREAQKTTPLGRKLSKYIFSGTLAPMHLVHPIISRELKAIRDRPILFDGIPRASSQIEAFFELLKCHDLRICAVLVLHLDLPKCAAPAQWETRLQPMREALQHGERLFEVTRVV